MIERFVDVADYVSPSKLSDFVINPYVGCPHACRYCYACFMKRFTNHFEPWGEFLDVKRCSKPLGAKRLTGKSAFMSSVTDPYNPAEARYRVTRRILEELAPIDCELTITTKSDLVLRDLDLLTERNERFSCGTQSKFSSLTGDEEVETIVTNRPKLRVVSSINTLDEDFRADMDAASPISARLNVLKTCREQGISTVLFMSPIFPFITDFQAIVDRSKDFVDAIWFENLNLRPGYKEDILAYIRARFPTYYADYLDIYRRDDRSYWHALKDEIANYCENVGVSYEIFFHY